MNLICISFAGKYSDSLRYNYKPSLYYSNISSHFYLDSFMILVDRILKDPSIKVVLIHYHNNFQVKSFSALEEIADQLTKLTESGIQVYFYSEKYNFISFYLASACSKTYIHKAGMLYLRGLGITEYYFKEILDKYDIEVEVISSGEEKTLCDRFLYNGMKDTQKEVFKELIEIYYKTFFGFVSGNKKKSVEEIKSLFKRKVISASQLVSEGWIDEISSFRMLMESLKSIYKIKKLPVKILRRNRIGRNKNKLAILFLEGMLKEGVMQKMPSFNKTANEGNMISNLRIIGRDEDIKGLVLRIDSAGGSVIAAQNILDELEKIAEKKTVVVSIGKMATSAAYWIALKSKMIIANNTSVTGSIGVISSKVAIGNLLNKKGINYTCVGTEYSADPLFLRKYSQEESESVMNHLVQLKNMFMSDIYENRKIASQEFSKIGSGRIFNAKQALDLGLIDAIGTLETAVKHLADLVQVKEYQLELFPQIKTSLLSDILNSKLNKIFSFGFAAKPTLSIQQIGEISDLLLDPEPNAFSLPAYFFEPDLTGRTGSQFWSELIEIMDRIKII